MWPGSSRSAERLGASVAFVLLAALSACDRVDAAVADDIGEVGGDSNLPPVASAVGGVTGAAPPVPPVAQLIAAVPAAPAVAVVPVPGAPTSFADLVTTVSPAVVNIYTQQVMEIPRYRGYPGIPFGVPDQRVAESLGSGVLIDDQGHILTNSHVVDNATALRVRLHDGTELDASVVGVDPLTDIAVARIEPFAGMHWLPIGDSDAVRVGDWLVAVGNPFGLNSSVTAGILSARGRSDVPLGGDIRYIDFLQTDASINPGNSGGPLVNMRGEVVGINTAINAEGQGIGFAIPSNMARDIYTQLISDGRVERSWLGVFIESVDEELATRLGLPDHNGAVVTGVVKGGPAQIAGLQPGDVIRTFNGETVRNSNELAWIASRAGVGQTVPVVIRRGDHDLPLDVVLGELPE